MAIEAENIFFENMGFGPFAIFSPQDCFMGPVLGIEDGGLCFQGLEHLSPFVDAYDNLTGSSSSTSFLPVEIVQSLACEFEKQRMEMDWFLQMENKRLRCTILEEESRQQAVIMQKYESRMRTLMVQKDEELALARNRSRELQQLLGGAEMEARAWEKAAKEGEAIVSDLTNRLNQAKERERCEDAVSFCGSSGERGERKMGCKLCQFGRSCVVFFPCRHLCCCKPCEQLLEHCPVCQTVKEASLEAFLA